MITLTSNEVVGKMQTITDDPSVQGKRISSDSDLPTLPFEAEHMTLSPGAISRRHEVPFDPGKQVTVSTEEGKGPEFEMIVNWGGNDDPENPFNWPAGKKWRCTIMFSLFTILSPMSSTMVIPALDKISKDLSIDEGIEQTMVMSIFMLGYALGPFVLGPLSETYGRVKVLQGANLFYLVFNIGCAVARTKNEILVFRFLSGMGGAAPQAIGHGYLADIWPKKDRGKSLAIYGIACWSGPCIAPIFGAYVSGYLTWRWVFWAISILCACVQFVAIFTLKEAYEPVLLERKARRIRKEVSTEKTTGVHSRRWGLLPRQSQEAHTVVRTNHHVKGKLKHVVTTRISLAFIMMFTHPAVYLPSLFRAYLYGLMYLVISTCQHIWKDTYHQSTTDASLNYLSALMGMLVSLQVTSNFIDSYHERKKLELRELKKRERRERRDKGENSPDNTKDKDEEEDEEIPEWRIPPMLISGILVPLGLIIYGWSAQYHVNSIVPNTGIFILFLGLLPGFNCPAAYITDTYGKEYTASAQASGAFLRTMCGFSFPLFGPGLFATLGTGWGTMLMAASTLVMGVAPLSIHLWGPYLRAHSTKGMPEVKEKMMVKTDEEALVEGQGVKEGINHVGDKERKGSEGKIKDDDGLVTNVVEKDGEATTPEGQIETTHGTSQVVELGPNGESSSDEALELNESGRDEIRFYEQWAKASEDQGPQEWNEAEATARDEYVTREEWAFNVPDGHSDGGLPTTEQVDRDTEGNQGETKHSPLNHSTR